MKDMSVKRGWPFCRYYQKNNNCTVMGFTISLTSLDTGHDNKAYIDKEFQVTDYRWKCRYIIYSVCSRELLNLSDKLVSNLSI
jgi:hypothetical protein